MRSSRVVTVLLQICIFVFPACIIGAYVLSMFEASMPEKLFQTLMLVLGILGVASIAVFFLLLFIYSFIFSRQKKHREKQAKKASAEATQFARKAGAYHTYVPPVTPPPTAPPPVTPPPQPPEAEPMTAQTVSAVPPTTAATGQPSASAVPPVTPPPTPQPTQDTTKPAETVKKALGNKTLRRILLVIAVLIVLRLVIAVVPVIASGDGFSTASIVQVCQNLFQATTAREVTEETSDTARSSGMDFLSFVVFIVIGFFILRRLNLSKLFQPLPDAVTNQIILEELRRGFGETASYQKGAGITASQLEKIRCAGVFPEGFSYEGRECFSGVFQGKPFEAAVFTCVINKRYENGATFQETLFSGLWIQREMQHYTTEPVGLRSATVKEIEAEIMENGLKTPEGLEVEAFNRLFRVPSKDLHEVYYLITPDQMEQLAALYQRFGCDAKGRLWLLFSENQVQYGLNTNFTLYQFQGTKNEPTSLAQARSRVAAKVQEAMQLMALYDTLGF